MFFLFIYWLSWPKSTTMCILNRLWRYLTTLVVVLNCFDIPTDFNEIAERIFKSLLKSGVINEDVTRYLPGMCRLRFQGLIKKKKKKKKILLLLESLNRGYHSSGTATQRTCANLIDKIKKFTSTVAVQSYIWNKVFDWSW